MRKTNVLLAKFVDGCSFNLSQILILIEETKVFFYIIEFSYRTRLVQGTDCF
jgi:hypothetical protein